jgi:hypothetical protein
VGSRHYCFLNFVVGRKILLHIMSDEKVEDRHVPVAVQCKSAKCTIQPCLNIIYKPRKIFNLKYYKILRHTITLRKQYTSSGILALDAVLPLPVVVRTVHWTKTPLDSPAMDRPSTPIKSSILQNQAESCGFETKFSQSHRVLSSSMRCLFR